MNNPTRVIEAVAEIVTLSSNNPQGKFHVADVQVIVKVPLDLYASHFDLSSISRHKFN
ncbi:cysteine desulfurase NifS, partial [Bacillus cereus]|nr:cysteine desulfurase NifS [Bacillus cereus]